MQPILIILYQLDWKTFHPIFTLFSYFQSCIAGVLVLKLIFKKCFFVPHCFNSWDNVFSVVPSPGHMLMARNMRKLYVSGRRSPSAAHFRNSEKYIIGLSVLDDLPLRPMKNSLQPWMSPFSQRSLPCLLSPRVLKFFI